MKFKTVMTFEYEVDDETLMEAYDTTDPEEIAKIDEKMFTESPQELIYWTTEDTLNVMVSPVVEHG